MKIGHNYPETRAAAGEVERAIISVLRRGPATAKQITRKRELLLLRTVRSTLPRMERQGRVARVDYSDEGEILWSLGDE